MGLGTALLLVYSDLVNGLWVNRYDLGCTAGELRSAVYKECLQGLLPVGTSSAQLNIYYVKDGVKYEPEVTFRLRMHQHITTHHPQKISVVSELCATIAEVRKGHVHLIIGFSDWPLVTIPSEASGIAPAPGIISSPISSGDSASVEKTVTVIIAPGDEGTRTPSAADFPTQSYAPTALVRDDRGAPPSASDHIPLEILCPAFAYFMGGSTIQQKSPPSITRSDFFVVPAPHVDTSSALQPLATQRHPAMSSPLRSAAAARRRRRSLPPAAPSRPPLPPAGAPPLLCHLLCHPAQAPLFPLALSPRCISILLPLTAAVPPTHHSPSNPCRPRCESVSAVGACACVAADPPSPTGRHQSQIDAAPSIIHHGRALPGRPDPSIPIHPTLRHS
ncbi:hypothetical protein C8Q76DRAFT_804139 [Earliella scabrosa]|nr:hypothetical protein C8Q76DRAFT_804139 [Earliella scabrosa]